MVLCATCKIVNAIFNYPGVTDGNVCKSCIQPGMVDVKNPKCIECKKKQPRYNSPGEKKALYCAGCAKDGMVDLYAKLCQECNKVVPIFNYPGEKKPSHCYSCKKAGHCFRCFIYNFPDETPSKQYRIKEKHVADYIKDTFPDLEITFNKQIDGGCSKRRPDIFIDRLTHSIIVEVDEEQHKNYDITCELSRINELYTDLGDRPIIMIRFNPDAYMKDGKRIPSCFKYHKISGAPLIDDKKDWNDRLDALKNTIENYINNIPQEPLTIEYMFYNM